MRGAALLLAALPLAAPALAAEDEAPQLSNGRLERHALAGSLADAVAELVRAASSPAWIGWAVPSDRPREACCWDSPDDVGCCAGCRLEGGARRSGTASVARLESLPRMLVLLRAEKGALGKLRSYSAGCPLDGGGTTLHWLEDVPPADSARFLDSLLDPGRAPVAGRRVADGALAALAFHAEPAALEALIARARRHDDGRLRGKALFWLSQRAGEKAVQAIAGALADDPETDVKKKAVFALSQLPRDEGVPLLIQTARANRNPEVRKQAFFWLGQSKDPRALAFFEEVLR